MRIGAVFPQTEAGADPAPIRAWAQGVAALGYDHILSYDHVVGADPAVHAGWSAPYDVDDTFHEPLVLCGYLAAVVDLELVTGVVVLPQRQTALVAKQAAQVDLLTGGRFRLGVGLGWNTVEYAALGQDFSSRGRRAEDQVALLRRLWTERSVTHELGDERVVGAGLAPLPRQRPIPIWFGARSDPAYRRAGRLGDGWFPRVPPGPELDRARAMVAQAAAEAGRDPAAVGMEAIVDSRPSASEMAADVERWQAAGATHAALNTMGGGWPTLEAHLEALARVAALVGLSPAPPRP